MAQQGMISDEALDVFNRALDKCEDARSVEFNDLVRRVAPEESLEALSLARRALERECRDGKKRLRRGEGPLEDHVQIIHHLSKRLIDATSRLTGGTPHKEASTTSKPNAKAGRKRAASAAPPGQRPAPRVARSYEWEDKKFEAVSKREARQQSSPKMPASYLSTLSTKTKTDTPQGTVVPGSTVRIKQEKKQNNLLKSDQGSWTVREVQELGQYEEDEWVTKDCIHHKLASLENKAIARMMRQSLEMRCVPERAGGRFKGQQARQEIKQTTMEWCRKMPLAFSQDIKRKAWGRILGANWNSEGTLACPRKQNTYSQVRRILNSKNPTENLDTYKVVGASLVDLQDVQVLLRANGQHELAKALQFGPLRFPEPFEDGDIDRNIQRWAAARLIQKKTLYRDLTIDVIHAIYSFECGLEEMQQRTGNSRVADKNVAAQKAPRSTPAKSITRIATPKPASEKTTNTSVNNQMTAQAATTKTRIGTIMPRYRADRPVEAAKITDKNAEKARASTSYKATPTAATKTNDARAITPGGSRLTGAQLARNTIANSKPTASGAPALGFLRRQNASATLGVSRLTIDRNNTKSTSTASQAKQATPKKNDRPWAFYGNSAPPAWQ